MTNRHHIASQEVQRLERMLATRRDRLTASQSRATAREGIDPDGRLRRAVAAVEDGRRKLAAAQDRLAVLDA
jgi:SMC interacting uncharacterized protein involved in chromosome segregation